MPTPYYQDKYCTIYHGDCSEITGSIDTIDLTITDPPYGIKYCSNHRKNKHDKIRNDDKFPVDFITYLLDRSKSALYFFLRWNQVLLIPVPTSMIAWIKNNWTAGDLEHAHGRMWEAIAFYPGKNHRFVKRIPDVIECAKTNNIYHPTQKPIKLLRTLIACNFCETIFDPYCGSGSTLIAAKELGKKSIGIEIEEKYCEIAAKRLSQEVFDFNNLTTSEG